MSLNDNKSNKTKLKTLDEEILTLVGSIAETSYQNHQRLADQGEIIHSWNNDENKMNYKLKQSTQYLNKIGSYIYSVSKFFSKNYYYPPIQKMENPSTTIKDIKVNFEDTKTFLSLNLIDDPNYELEENLKKKLEIIKNIQLNITDQLDDQIEELKNHDNTISKLKSEVNLLDQKIFQYLN